jgi:hypothetical protein
MIGATRNGQFICMNPDFGLHVVVGGNRPNPKVAGSAGQEKSVFFILSDEGRHG